jgi:hypothetical protein
MSNHGTVDVLAFSQQTQSLYFLTLGTLLVLLLIAATAQTIRKRRSRD